MCPEYESEGICNRKRWSSKPWHRFDVHHECSYRPTNGRCSKNIRVKSVMSRACLGRKHRLVSNLHLLMDSGSTDFVQTPDVRLHTEYRTS
ncbi:hypothetical protein TNCV_4017071 [Trichonephila clavipes]|nr:hypothetical protein TNCV_4017071 [Trichonephila clavipes]